MIIKSFHPWKPEQAWLLISICVSVILEIILIIHVGLDIYLGSFFIMLIQLLNFLFTVLFK